MNVCADDGCSFERTVRCNCIEYYDMYTDRCIECDYLMAYNPYAGKCDYVSLLDPSLQQFYAECYSIRTCNTGWIVNAYKNGCDREMQPGEC